MAMILWNNKETQGAAGGPVHCTVRTKLQMQGKLLAFFLAPWHIGEERGHQRLWTNQILGFEIPVTPHWPPILATRQAGRLICIVRSSNINGSDELNSGEQWLAEPKYLALVWTGKLDNTTSLTRRPRNGRNLSSFRHKQ
jgi:hypothetical protein